MPHEWDIFLAKKAEGDVQSAGRWGTDGAVVLAASAGAGRWLWGARGAPKEAHRPRVLAAVEAVLPVLSAAGWGVAVS